MNMEMEMQLKITQKFTVMLMNSVFHSMPILVSVIMRKG